jgi:hypothetical protein
MSFESLLQAPATRAIATRSAVERTWMVELLAVILGLLGATRPSRKRSGRARPFASALGGGGA